MITQTTDSWLTPEGKLIPVEFAGHNDYARDFLKVEFPNWKDCREYMRSIMMQYPYEVLHHRGWVRIKINHTAANPVRILGGCIDNMRILRNTIDPAMNSKQLKVAKEICKEFGVTLLDAINDKRF